MIIIFNYPKHAHYKLLFAFNNKHVACFSQNNKIPHTIFNQCDYCLGMRPLSSALFTLQ